LSDDPSVFANVEGGESLGRKIAWSEDLGFLPVDGAVRASFAAARQGFLDIGCIVEEAAPDLRDAPAAFQTLRAHGFAAQFADYYDHERDKLKDTVQWNTEKGLTQTAREIGRAELDHTAIYRRMVAFFEEYDFLVLPTTQVLPFPKELDWVREIEGVTFENYLQWMEICTAISVTGCPSISVPCGFSDGLPVGLQIVGPPGADLAVLKMAHAFERENGASAMEPEILA
jgi:amidase